MPELVESSSAIQRCTFIIIRRNRLQTGDENKHIESRPHPCLHKNNASDSRSVTPQPVSGKIIQPDTNEHIVQKSSVCQNGFKQHTNYRNTDYTGCIINGSENPSCRHLFYKRQRQDKTDSCLQDRCGKSK